MLTYDKLNRLASAQTTSSLWGNTYVYDIWGNLLQKNQVQGKLDGECLQQGVMESNRISGYCYDAAGNLTIEGVCGPALTYTYDAGSVSFPRGDVPLCGLYFSFPSAAITRSRPTTTRAIRS